MPKSRCARHGEVRLLWVELPRMDVESPGRSSTLRARQRGVDQSGRQDTEVGATARGQSCTEPLHRGRRNLVQAAGCSGDDMRIALTANVTVAVATHREEARVVRVPFLDERVEGPLAAANDRKTRSAVAKHRAAADVLEDRFGIANR